MAAGAGEVLRSALRTHSDNANVAKWGCGGLRSLAYINADDQDGGWRLAHLKLLQLPWKYHIYTDRVTTQASSVLGLLQ